MQKLLLLACAASLAACSNTPKVSVAAQTCPQPLQPPAHLMMKPLPEAGYYSENARLNMLEWQK